jgi:hypothetical protein
LASPLLRVLDRSSISLRGAAMKTGLLAVFLVMALGAVADTLNAADGSTPVPMEYQVKAAFLYRFIHFIEWPEAMAPLEEGAVVIGVIGSGPMHAALVSMAAGGNCPQRLVIKRFDRAGDLEFCHIIFVSASARTQAGEILKRLGGNSTLTVGEFEGFADRGGMINFVIVKKMVRFEINPDAAKRANLTVSSKLLRLAKIVGENQ